MDICRMVTQLALMLDMWHKVVGGQMMTRVPFFERKLTYGRF